MSAARGWYWPWLVTAALLFTVGVNVVILVAASSDRTGSVVEADYYGKAVAWDQTMALRAASDLLQWSASARIARPLEQTEAPGELTVRLRDRAGGSVRGAQAAAVLIHNLEAGDPQRIELRESDPGTYVGAFSALRAGRWEVRVEARRGEERFVRTLFAEAPE